MLRTSPGGGGGCEGCGASAAAEAYEFGPFRFEPGESRLLRDGRPVPLPPKAVETLLALVERSGSLVSKGELMSRVWGRRFVEENSLAKCVCELRKALGDRRGAPAYIETVSTRGYRFVATVRRRAVAAALPADWTADWRREILRRSAADPHAYRLYREARVYVMRYTSSGWRKGVERFELAIAQDPAFALARADLAIALVLASVYFTGSREILERARCEAQRALVLAPDLAEAHLATALVRYLVDWDWDAAEAGFHRALACDPAQAWVHDYYGYFLTLMGRIGEARPQLERAVDLHPVRLTVNGDLGLHHYLTGDPERAIEHHLAALELDPHCGLVRVDLGRAYEQAGRPDLAAAEHERTRHLDDAPWVDVWRARAYAFEGREDEARRLLGRIAERARRAEVSEVFPALVHVALGEHRQALALLGAACARRSPWMTYLGAEPGLAPLRHERAFAALAERAGLHRRLW